jgi:hypothetical protein
MRRCSQYEAVSGKASLIPLVDLAVRLENQAYNSIFAPGQSAARHVCALRYGLSLPPRGVGSVA